jgi:hypothetical protein
VVTVQSKPVADLERIIECSDMRATGVNALRGKTRIGAGSKSIVSSTVEHEIQKMSERITEGEFGIRWRNMSGQRLLSSA